MITVVLHPSMFSEAFKGHRGRPGHRGGSLPRSGGAVLARRGVPIILDPEYDFYAERDKRDAREADKRTPMVMRKVKAVLKKLGLRDVRTAPLTFKVFQSLKDNETSYREYNGVYRRKQKVLYINPLTRNADIPGLVAHEAAHAVTDRYLADKTYDEPRTQAYEDFSRVVSSKKAKPVSEYAAEVKQAWFNDPTARIYHIESLAEVARAVVEDGKYERTVKRANAAAYRLGVEALKVGSAKFHRLKRESEIPVITHRFEVDAQWIPIVRSGNPVKYRIEIDVAGDDLVEKRILSPNAPTARQEALESTITPDHEDLPKANGKGRWGHFLESLDESFKGHKGIRGHRGGSLPRGATGSRTVYDARGGVVNDPTQQKRRTAAITQISTQAHPTRSGVTLVTQYDAAGRIVSQKNEKVSRAKYIPVITEGKRGVKCPDGRFRYEQEHVTLDTGWTGIITSVPSTKNKKFLVQVTSGGSGFVSVNHTAFVPKKETEMPWSNLLRMVESFKGHRGRKGKRGGSLPRGAAPSGGEAGTVRTSNVLVAAKALGLGKNVELNQPRQVSTLLNRLANLTADAIRRGKSAPVYDLCKVSVKGTNLFCAQSKGIPRIKMPQLGGIPIKGSLADKLPKNDRGGVDLAPLFRAHLRKRGVTITDVTEKASYLRASQNELNGGKVAGIAGAIRAGKMSSERIFVSQDNYIVDGHHRWAGQVGVDVLDNKLGDVKMPIARVNMPIVKLLSMANRFAKKMGMPQVSKKESLACASCGIGRWTAFLGRLREAGFNPGQHRDPYGKWVQVGVAPVTGKKTVKVMRKNRTGQRVDTGLTKVVDVRDPKKRSVTYKGIELSGPSRERVLGLAISPNVPGRVDPTYAFHGKVTMGSGGRKSMPFRVWSEGLEEWVTGRFAASSSQNHSKKFRQIQKLLPNWKGFMAGVKTCAAAPEGTSFDLEGTALAQWNIKRVRDSYAALYLLMRTGIRSSAREGSSAVRKDGKIVGRTTTYGATTLQKQHVKVSGSTVYLDFPGKTGKEYSTRVTDSVLAQSMKHRLKGKSATDRVFPDASYVDVRKVWGLETDGKSTKLHDIRTVTATLLAHREVSKLSIKDFTTKRAAKAAMDGVADTVAEKLNDKASQGYKSYIHPAVWVPFASTGVKVPGLKDRDQPVEGQTKPLRIK